MESGNTRSDNRCFFYIPRDASIAHSLARSAEADFRTERVLRAANCRPRCSLKMKKKPMNEVVVPAGPQEAENCGYTGCTECIQLMLHMMRDTAP